MMKRLLIVLAAVAVFAAGCANSSMSDVGTSSSAARGESAAPPSSDASGAPSPSASGGSEAPSPGASGASGGSSPGASGTSTKLTGTLEQGVEPNCVVLKGAGPDHVLIFRDPEVGKQGKVGDTVTVVGLAKPTQITTCQQGIPFIVSAMAVD